MRGKCGGKGESANSFMRRNKNKSERDFKKGSVKDKGTAPSHLYVLVLLSFLCRCGLPVFDRKSLSMVF